MLGPASSRRQQNDMTRRLSYTAAAVLRSVNAGNIGAVLVLADALEEAGDDERARSIRLYWLKMTAAVEKLHGPALLGDKGRKTPVAEKVARLYAWMLWQTRSIMGTRTRYTASYGLRILSKKMLPVGWAVVRAWREETATGGLVQ